MSKLPPLQYPFTRRVRRQFAGELFRQEGRELVVPFITGTIYLVPRKDGRVLVKATCLIPSAVPFSDGEQWVLKIDGDEFALDVGSVKDKGSQPVGPAIAVELRAVLEVKGQ